MKKGKEIIKLKDFGIIYYDKELNKVDINMYDNFNYISSELKNHLFNYDDTFDIERFTN